VLECGSVQQVYDDAYNGALPQNCDGVTNLHK
jgi:hypothetical protein